MKRRGFTLIELLAVIIILAVIALITTPIVMKVIESSKKSEPYKEYWVLPSIITIETLCANSLDCKVAISLLEILFVV